MKKKEDDESVSLPRRPTRRADQPVAVPERPVELAKEDQGTETREETVRRVVTLMGEIINLQRIHSINATEAANAVRNPKLAAPMCDHFSIFAGAFAGLVKRRAAGFEPSNE